MYKAQSVQGVQTVQTKTATGKGAGSDRLRIVDISGFVHFVHYVQLYQYVQYVIGLCEPLDEDTQKLGLEIWPIFATTPLKRQFCANLANSSTLFYT